MTSTVEQHLQTFHEQHGDEAWRNEVRRLAVAALRTGSEDHRRYWKALTSEYDWLSWDELEQLAGREPPSADRLIAQALKSQMPGIRSQAQYDAVVGALEAAQLVVNALLNVDLAREQEARAAFELALDAIRKATELTLKLEDSPEAATSASARQFMDEPAQFRENEIEAQLMEELRALGTLAALNDWYLASKARREKLVTKSVRDNLHDAIRARRNALC